MAVRHGLGSTTCVLSAPPVARAHLLRHVEAAVGSAFGDAVDIDGVVTHDGDLFVHAELRLHTGGGVVHAGTLEARQVLDREAPVFDAAGDDDRACEQGLAVPVAEQHAVGLLVAVDPDRRLGDQYLRPELLRLIVRASRQFLAGDPERKPEIVLDARARPRLTARRVRFNHHDAQAF